MLVAGGVENITLVQNEHMNFHRIPDPRLLAAHPNTHMSMLETAEIVAKKFGISREAQDEYALQSQQRTAAAQAAGKFDDEIIPVTTDKLMVDKESGESHTETLPSAKTRATARTPPLRVWPDGAGHGWTVTAGNASQLSDGASACVLMEAKDAEKRVWSARLLPGYRRGRLCAGYHGIGPVFAVPKLLQRHGLKVYDIGLWELNEAFAVQVLYCRDELGIDNDRSTSTAAHLHWPSLWHVRRAHGGSRPDRG